MLRLLTIIIALVLLMSGCSDHRAQSISAPAIEMPSLTDPSNRSTKDVERWMFGHHADRGDMPVNVHEVTTALGKPQSLLTNNSARYDCTDGVIIVNYYDNGPEQSKCYQGSGACEDPIEDFRVARWTVHLK